MNLFYSFIIPVYNRPDEVKALLESFSQLRIEGQHYEVIIIEDGSSKTSDEIIKIFESQLSISYYSKQNSGPGDSRNYGMSRAKGDYFIILDSDVLLPKNYLKNVDRFLQREFVDCYGGADAADQSFTPVQKAINFSMTSFLTTGGIRGKARAVEKFKPRSFNMGLSRRAFEASGGYAKIAVGEDLDLSIRLQNKGFKVMFIPDAEVYHKRRNTWRSFYKQVHKFGMGRPILNQWYPGTAKLVFWLPSIFVIGAVTSAIGLIFQVYLLLNLYILYFLLIFVSSSVTNKNIYVGFLSVYSAVIQFFGYGLGFLKSIYHINLRHQTPEEAFPELFFK